MKTWMVVTLEAPQCGASDEYHKLCFWGEIRKKILILFSWKKKCLSDAMNSDQTAWVNWLISVFAAGLLQLICNLLIMSSCLFVFCFCFLLLFFFHVTSGSVVQICTQPTGIIHFSRGKPQNWQSADPECSIWSGSALLALSTEISIKQ